MPRGPRCDRPGQLFHVMNRGIAKRTMFERAADFRYFMSRLGRSVHRAELDMLAFALMSTHFHLIVRSHGHLSEAMRRVQGPYTGHFNRTRGRFGGLQCGRFLSKPIRSDLYLANSIGYVEENPVQAGIVEDPVDYPWGSAAARAHGRHRQWLSDDFAHLSRASSRPADRAARAAFVEAWLNGRGGQNPYESVVSMAPDRVAAWMKERARLADGTAPGLPVAGVEPVRTEIARGVARHPETAIKVPGGKRQSLIALLSAGLLRDLCGVSYARLAQVLQTTDPRAKRLYQHHCRCVEATARYRALAAEIVVACLGRLAPRNR
jgi:REP element-mobilizing transposase RayT